MQSARAFALFTAALLFILSPQALPAEPQPLTASDGAAGDGFGFSVAATPGRIVVGAPDATVNGNATQGAAYVFERRGSSWVEIAKLVALDGGAGESFGYSVAMAGERIFVGAPNAFANGQSLRGAVYVFEVVDSGWTQTEKVFSPEVLAGDQFGFSIAADGENLLVGVPNGRTPTPEGPPEGLQTGTAYLYTLVDGAWQETAKFMAPFPEFTATFGDSVAIEGNLAIIGEPRADDSGGSIYIFEFVDGAWQPLASREYAAHGVRVGHDVAVSGTQFAAGAPYGDSATDPLVSGVVYTYTLNPDATLDEVIVTPADGSPEGFFGGSLAMDASRMAVGAGGGKAYLFEHDGLEWQEARQFQATVSDAALTPYLVDVALSGDIFVIGDPQATVGENAQQGTAYVHDIVDPDPAGDDVPGDDNSGEDIYDTGGVTGDTEDNDGTDPGDEDPTPDGMPGDDNSGDNIYDTGGVTGGMEDGGDAAGGDGGDGGGGALLLLLPALACAARARRRQTPLR